jgi:hypothetical protein
VVGGWGWTTSTPSPPPTPPCPEPISSHPSFTSSSSSPLPHSLSHTTNSLKSPSGKEGPPRRYHPHLTLCNPFLVPHLTQPTTTATPRTLTLLPDRHNSKKSTTKLVPPSLPWMMIEHRGPDRKLVRAYKFCVEPEERHANNTRVLVPPPRSAGSVKYQGIPSFLQKLHVVPHSAASDFSSISRQFDDAGDRGGVWQRTAAGCSGRKGLSTSEGLPRQ